MKPAKASGVNIPEAQRTTVQIKLRLDVDVAEDLDAAAKRWGVTRSQAVTQLVASLMYFDVTWPCLARDRRAVPVLARRSNSLGTPDTKA